MREHLLDDIPITFTHGDLHPSNIMVSPHGTPGPRVLAIVDWYQSGWLPEHWEACKAYLTATIESDWFVTYLPSFLEMPGKYFEAFDAISLAYGC
jgi:hypothetical protein